MWLTAHGCPLGSSPGGLPEDLLKEFHQRFTASVLRWLDEGYGSCRLRRPDAAAVVASALRHFDGERYKLGAWVVMPNHVHVLLSPLDGFELSQIVQSWKSFTARSINQLDGRTGAFWQKEFYDHIVRDEEQLEKLEQYIWKNPVKAKLRKSEYLMSEQRRPSPPFSS